MNHITVQLQPGNRYFSGSSVLLTINNDLQIQLSFNIEDYARTYGHFDENAAEFAYFASVIYGCDRAIKREGLDGDRWTREFVVQIPVADPDKWASVKTELESVIEFLTGDIWHLDFTASISPLFGRAFKTARRNFRNRTRLRGAAVSLFSGGLDSLIGAIDWLNGNQEQRILLASTYDAHAEKAASDQDRLISPLITAYPNRIQRCVARVGLCSGGEDTNFRSRSLPFIGNAMLAASFLESGTPIIVPENGAIALNYPLTPARKGSLSTRTVHPHYIGKLNYVISSLGFNHPIINPYGFKTKGEMVSKCSDFALLSLIYSGSASCGKRGHKEWWEDRLARQCGACVPCIFRRAAVHRAGLPAEQFGFSLSAGTALQNILAQPNNDLVSVVDFIRRHDDNATIWQTLKSNGQLDYSQKDEYISLIVRLRDELTQWAHSLNII